MSGQQRNHHGSVNHLSDSEEDWDSGLSSEPSSPPGSPSCDSPQQPLVQAARPQGSKTPQLYGHIGEWKKFENMFHFVAEMCQWTEQGKLEKLKACLQNQGITNLRTLPPKVASNYQDLVQQLRQQFQEAEIIEACRRQLLGIRKQVDVSSKQFADRFRGLVSTAYQADATAKESFLRGLREKNVAMFAANCGPLPNIQATLEAVKDADAYRKSVGRHVEALQSCSRRPSGSGSTPSKLTTVNIAVHAFGNMPHQLLATENVPPDKTPRSSPMSSPRGRKPDPDRCFGRNQRSHFHSKCPLTESPKGNGRQ